MDASLTTPARRRGSVTTSVLFALVVALCLGQVVWWTYFQFRETRNLETAARLLQAGRVDEAARALGSEDVAGLSERARRRRVMFISEGTVLSLLVLVGVVFFYHGMLRERRLRRTQERFLTGATHELKTPLATIRLGLESLQAGSMPPGKRGQYLRAMVQAASALERDIDNVLMAAQLGTARGGLRPTAGDLADDLHEVLREMEPRCEAAGLSLRADRLEPAVVSRDRAAIRSVLRNLLDNAVKYSRPGGTIRAELRRVGGSARLEIADDGRGMTPDEVEHAFDRFFRGNGKDHLGGAGLGLYLVRELVRAHGGRVDAHSDGPDRGAEVRITLPLHQDAGAPRAVPPPEKGPVP